MEQLGSPAIASTNALTQWCMLRLLESLQVLDNYGLINMCTFNLRLVCGIDKLIRLTSAIPAPSSSKTRLNIDLSSLAANSLYGLRYFFPSPFSIMLNSDISLPWECACPCRDLGPQHSDLICKLESLLKQSNLRNDRYFIRPPLLDNSSIPSLMRERLEYLLLRSQNIQGYLTSIRMLHWWKPSRSCPRWFWS